MANSVSDRSFDLVPNISYDEGPATLHQTDEVVQELAQDMLGKGKQPSKPLEKRVELWTLDQFDKVKYSHPTIAPILKDGSMSIDELKQTIAEKGWKQGQPLELIEHDKGEFTSWNNRRLFCLKQIFKENPVTNDEKLIGKRPEGLALTRGNSPDKSQRKLQVVDNAASQQMRANYKIEHKGKEIPKKNLPTVRKNGKTFPTGKIKPESLNCDTTAKNHYVCVSITEGNEPCKSKDIKSMQETIKKERKKKTYSFNTDGFGEVEITNPTHLHKLALRAAIDEPKVFAGEAGGEGDLFGVTYRGTGVDQLGEHFIPMGYTSVKVRNDTK